MTTPHSGADSVHSRGAAARPQKLDLSPVPPTRHAEFDEEVVLTSSIPALHMDRSGVYASMASAIGSTNSSVVGGAGGGGGAYHGAGAHSGASELSHASGEEGDADPSMIAGGHMGMESNLSVAFSESMATGADDDDKDLATARPSHRRLAEFTPNLRSWDHGHRIEVFLRIR
jgi:hypothetical protein